LGLDNEGIVTCSLHSELYALVEVVLNSEKHALQQMGTKDTGNTAWQKYNISYLDE